MEIDVLLFGPACAALGAEKVRVTIPEKCTARDALTHLASREPRLRPFVAAGRLAVNHRFADSELPIKPGDEVALIAMVSGG